MNHLLSQLAKKVISSEEDKQKVDRYVRLQSQEGWKIHQEYLLYLRGLMAEDLLSDRFTALKPIEKDICQRAYAMVDQMVLFLLDPLVKARRINVIAVHNKRMEATLTGATTKGA